MSVNCSRLAWLPGYVYAPAVYLVMMQRPAMRPRMRRIIKRMCLSYPKSTCTVYR